MVEDAFEDCPRCQFCGRVGDLLYARVRDAQFDYPGEWNWRICADCDVAWLDPRVIFERSSELYSRYHTHGRDFSRPSFLSSSGAATRWVSPVPAGKLLDVGCGSGGYLAEMRRRGWEVAGIDFDPRAVDRARARDLRVHWGTLADAPYAAASFDVITLGHLIEHLSDPAGTLRQCARLLRRGGKIVLVTPNLHAYGRKSFGPHWRGWEPPRHCTVFSEKSLRTLVGKTGLRTAACFTTGRWAWTMAAQSVAARWGRARGWPRTWALPYFLLRGLFFHARERRALRKYPAVGEELVLVAARP